MEAVADSDCVGLVRRLRRRVGANKDVVAASVCGGSLVAQCNVVAAGNVDNDKRFVVRSDELLTAFLELERITHELAVSALLGDEMGL
jgi:hypothetical protein